MQPQEQTHENGPSRRPHYVRPANEPYVAPIPGKHSRWGWVTGFLSRLLTLERTPSDYTTIAPRGYDGKRTPIFFFNGSGKGR